MVEVRADEIAESETYGSDTVTNTEWNSECAEEEEEEEEGEEEFEEVEEEDESELSMESEITEANEDLPEDEEYLDGTVEDTKEIISSNWKGRNSTSVEISELITIVRKLLVFKYR